METYILKMDIMRPPFFSALSEDVFLLPINLNLTSFRGTSSMAQSQTSVLRLALQRHPVLQDAVFAFDFYSDIEHIRRSSLIFVGVVASIK